MRVRFEWCRPGLDWEKGELVVLGIVAVGWGGGY